MPLSIAWMEAVTAKTILDKIQRRAVQKWGQEKWVANLVREYVEIAKMSGDDTATPVSRRSQIERAFKSGGCTLDTAIMLAAAVGCRFQMACTEITIEEF